MGLAESIQFFPKTDQGRVRELNEDNFLVDRKLALSIVADGMGGHAAGEVASAIAVRIIHQEMRKRFDLIRAYESGQATRDGAREIQSLMEGAVLRACSRVHEEAKADASKRGMGTTLSSLMVTGSHGFVAHVGDSRIYLCRDGKISQITEDHTVYNELIRRGRLTVEQIEKVAQKNAVTRAVGVYERVDVDTLMLDLLPGDQFLLASDGLHGYINHVAELEPFFEDEDGERASSELIDLANKKGGKDNITCVLVRLGRAGQADAEKARRLAHRREALKNMPLFSKLQERELLRVMQVAEVKEFEAGEEVMREGDRGDELFIVVDGALQIVRGEQVLSEVGPGEHFGEMALIRATPRSATVRAVEHSELLQIRRADFFSIVRKEYELAVKLLWQFLGVLADRLDQTSRDLSTAKEELAAEDISDAIAEDDEDGNRLSVDRISVVGLSGLTRAERRQERIAAQEAASAARAAENALRQEAAAQPSAPVSKATPYGDTVPSVTPDVRAEIRARLASESQLKSLPLDANSPPASMSPTALAPMSLAPSSMDPSALLPPPSQVDTPVRRASDPTPAGTDAPASPSSSGKAPGGGTA